MLAAWLLIVVALAVRALLPGAPLVRGAVTPLVSKRWQPQDGNLTKMATNGWQPGKMATTGWQDGKMATTEWQDGNHWMATIIIISHGRVLVYI